MSVPAFAGIIHLQGLHLSIIAATKRSWMPSVTITRLLAVQRWPVEKKAAVDGRAHGHVQVGVVQHHKRVLAAHLQLHLAPRPRRRRPRAGQCRQIQ